MAISNRNIYSLQLLRNGAAYADKATAFNALQSTSGLTDVVKKDGVAVLARYVYTSGTTKQLRTLVGYYAEASAMTETGEAQSYMTIIDVEGSAADVQEIRNMIGTGVTTANTVTQQLQDLSGNTTADTSGTTSVAGAKKYADEKVRAALDALDANSVADDNKIVSDVTQTDGQITATAKNLTAVKLGGYTEGTDADIAATDTLGEALGKLQAQINAMDKAASAVDGQVVTTVTEEDGKVTETKANVKDLQLGGYTKDTGATGDIASTDTINAALSKLENKAAAITIANADGSINVTTGTGGTDVNVNIKTGEHVLAKDGNGGLYTNIAISAVTGEELSGLGTNVKEAYKLVGTDSARLGEYIKIYKDSALVRFYLGHIDDKLTDEDETTHESPTSGVTDGTGNTALVYIMQLANSNYQLSAIDVESFLDEAEFKDGLQVNNHEVSVKVDTTSEEVTTGENVTAEVLSVSANGIKVNNIQNAINYAISTLDATVTGGTTAGDATTGHVQVVVGEADGKLTAVTVTEANIANASDLSALSGKTVTVVESSNSSITASLTAADDGTKKLDVITDASKINVSGFTAETGGFTAITEDSTVTEAFKVVEDVILKNEQTVSAALTDLDATKVDVIEVNGVASKTSASTDVVASVVIDGADIKLDGYTKGQDANHVAATDTVNQAIGKLENQIEAAVVGGLQSVEAGNGINVTAVANNKQTISVNLKADDGTTGWVNPLKVDANSKGLYFDSIDCGTY